MTESASDAGEDEVAFACRSCGPDDAIVDRIEQDIACCYIAAGEKLDDNAVCEEVADAVDLDLQAYYSRESARQRGVEF
jgi:hypothetical protein